MSKSEMPNALHVAALTAAGWAEENPTAPESEEILDLFNAYEESGFENDGYARSACSAMWPDNF